MAFPDIFRAPQSDNTLKMIGCSHHVNHGFKIFTNKKRHFPLALSLLLKLSLFLSILKSGNHQNATPAMRRMRMIALPHRPLCAITSAAPRDVGPLTENRDQGGRGNRIRMILSVIFITPTAPLHFFLVEKKDFARRGTIHRGLEKSGPTD
ncbi:MAG: hypothetical protein F8N37_16870 [Telmatospirillum sp.]|nr:hypothetical protein [Telmatospirillum sp.]